MSATTTPRTPELVIRREAAPRQHGLLDDRLAEVREAGDVQPGGPAAVRPRGDEGAVR